jgi:hypothetical protein
MVATSLPVTESLSDSVTGKAHLAYPLSPFRLAQIYATFVVRTDARC